MVESTDRDREMFADLLREYAERCRGLPYSTWDRTTKPERDLFESLVIDRFAIAREEGRREPQPITDAMIQAAVSAMMDYDEATEARGSTNWHDYARGALEAVEAARQTDG